MARNCCLSISNYEDGLVPTRKIRGNNSVNSELPMPRNSVKSSHVVAQRETMLEAIQAVHIESLKLV